MTITELQEAFTANDLSKAFDILKPHLRSTIRLYPNPVDEGNTMPGQSRIGGRPDMPPHITWPMEREAEIQVKGFFSIFAKQKPSASALPLSFIAQINMAEVKPCDADDLLPASGILYFFYAAEQDGWGFELTDTNKFRILYYDGDMTKLKPADIPENLPEYAQYKSCTLGIRQEVSLPSYNSDAFNELNEEEAELVDEIASSNTINKMLGYADEVQNEMEEECETMYREAYAIDNRNTPGKDFAEEAKNWLLLLQIDSNDENQMMWGDMGRLYFWMKKQDLLNKRFDRCWFKLQCY